MWLQHSRRNDLTIDVAEPTADARKGSMRVARAAAAAKHRERTTANPVGLRVAAISWYRYSQLRDALRSVRIPPQTAPVA